MSTIVNIELEREPLKKTTIRTTPTMSLQSIVLAACTSLKLEDPSAYGLRYNKVELDLSLSMRFASLPSGSIKLILFKSKQKLSKNEILHIALQIDDIGRVQVKVPASLTILELLLFAEQSSSTQSDPISIIYKYGPKSISSIFTPTKKVMEPRCIFMNQEISDFRKLSTTLLSDIGLTSGNGCINVSYTNTSVEMKEIVSIIEEASKSLEIKLNNYEMKEEPATIIKYEVNTTSDKPEPIPKIPPVDERLEIEESWGKKADLKIVEVIPIPVEDLPESFYEISEKEAIAFMKPPPQVEMLKTKMIRDREEREKQMKYPKTTIRLKFPDGVLLQMSFDSFENVSILFNYTDKILLPQFKEYQLFVSPPHLNLVRNKTFAEQKLAPSSIVHITFGTIRNGPFVLPELMHSLASIPQLAHAVSDQNISKNTIEVSPSSATGSKASIKSEKKMPKWFTNLKKKL